jgi:spore germination cell wall hydrolase CwlJ-like protein
MTEVSLEADGAPPSGLDIPVFRPVGEMVAGLQAAGAVVLALSLLGLHHPAEIAAPVKTAAQAVRPLIPPEGLAGPSAAALAPDSRAILQALLRKARLRPTLDPRRLSWDQARRVNAVFPADRAAPDIAQPFRLDFRTRNGRQALQCLTQAAYFEAGGNGPAGEAAVIQVVLNRVRHPTFPKSVCGVVYEGSDRDGGCQFTFTCDGALQQPVDPAVWDEARKVAQSALSGHVDLAVGTATYYHADYVFPLWAPSLVKLATVGPHIFYRMAGIEGAAAALTGRYAGGEVKLAKVMLAATKKDPQKAAPEARAKVQQASIPAGLKTEANRLQRVKAEIAAAAPLPPPKVETASIQAPAKAALQEQIQATLDAAGPLPTAPPPAALPTAAQTPPAQTPVAQTPVAQKPAAQGPAAPAPSATPPAQTAAAAPAA